MTHFPPLAWPDEHMADLFRMLVAAPGVPSAFKDPEVWPEPLRRELAHDDGRSAAARHRSELVAEFRRARAMLEDFAPDVIVLVGDDQYENFTETVVPPFCVFGLDAAEFRPWASPVGKLRPNVWGEAEQAVFSVRGHREAARAIARGLLERGIDMSYAYRTAYDFGLAHAFAYTILYLDYDRSGFPYRLVPLSVNCYGSALLTTRGGFRHLLEPAVAAEPPSDPPAPAPWRCMELGQALYRVLRESPWRVALIASSSWSHAFLTPRNGYLWPDHGADRQLLEALRAGDLDVWRRRSLVELEASGQHELLNWCVLLGAMEASGRPRPSSVRWIETWLFNSNKCFAAWAPPRGSGTSSCEASPQPR
jgi:hypothetical protein